MLEKGKILPSCKPHHIPFVATGWTEDITFTNNTAESSIVNGGTLKMETLAKTSFAEFRRQLFTHNLLLNKKIDLEVQSNFLVNCKAAWNELFGPLAATSIDPVEPQKTSIRKLASLFDDVGDDEQQGTWFTNEQ